MTTKHGYGIVMKFATGLGAYKNCFIDACVLEGFDADTAKLVKQLV